MTEKNTFNPFDMAKAQFDQTADLIGLNGQ